MVTFLLTWNPLKGAWPNDEFDEILSTIKKDGRAACNWSCGNTKKIRTGDRVFLLKQGPDPRGLIASGWVTSDAYSEGHWEDSGAPARPALYVDVDWDWLSKKPVISRTELDAPAYAGVHWNPQSSGTSIAAEVAHALEREWGARVGRSMNPRQRK